MHCHSWCRSGQCSSLYPSKWAFTRPNYCGFPMLRSRVVAKTDLPRAEFGRTDSTAILSSQIVKSRGRKARIDQTGLLVTIWRLSCGLHKTRLASFTGQSNTTGLPRGRRIVPQSSCELSSGARLHRSTIRYGTGCATRRSVF